MSFLTFLLPLTLHSLRGHLRHSCCWERNFLHMRLCRRAAVWWCDCTYTACRTHTSFGSLRTLCTVHCPSVVTSHLAQAVWWSKGVCLFCACHNSPHLVFLFDVSSVHFPHDQFDWPATSDISSDVPRPKIAGQAHSDIGDEKFGVLPPHRLWVQAVRQDDYCRWWRDVHERSKPRQYLWILKYHTRQHWMIRCSYSVWKFCFADFLRWPCSSERKQRKSDSGNRSRGWGVTGTILWLVMEGQCQE